MKALLKHKTLTRSSDHVSTWSFRSWRRSDPAR